MMKVQIEHGDCLEVMAKMIEAGIQVDSVVTDPPYHLKSIVKRFGADNAAPVKIKKFPGQTGSPFARSARGFMGKQWDGGDIAFQPETWKLCLDLLKPGGHLLCFGIPKQFGFMQVAVAEAGFELRDTILWLFGSGFPKSHNLDGGWEGWGTALKPAAEFICLARKPFKGTVAQNVQNHGTGALNIDGCRVMAEPGESLDGGRVSTKTEGWDRPWKHDEKAVKACRERGKENVAKAEQLGRWPANVVHDGSPEVLAAFPQSAGQQGDVRGTEPSHTGDENTACYGEFNRVPFGKRGDTGTAARFFYCAKADSGDRLQSKHPTVKPVDLMAWLVRLVTPPGGTVLDPFAGSGTTGMACIREGFNAILIEREAEYVADIKGRLDHIEGTDTPLFRGKNETA